MQITHHKPVARGVSQLMYVGDDQAVERALAIPTWLTIAAIGVLGFLAFKSR